MPGPSRPLRILQLITDRDRRGAQVFALDLAEGLRELGSVVDTVALAPGAHGDLLAVRALGRQRLGLRTLTELRRLARSYDVVVAHGSSTLPASAVGLAAARVPVVYRQVSDPKVWASSWSRRLRVAAFLRRVKAVVALSAGSSGNIKQHYWIRARPPVTVIPNAVPDDRFRRPTTAERADARSALGIPADDAVILFIGALAPEKAADLAIRAVSDVPAAVLLVVGDGPARADLEALASDRLPGRCLFAGPLEDPRVAYWSADLLLLPSRSESMPAVLIEAGLSGLASVATDVGAVTEIVDHGATGLVVPPGDSRAISSAVARLMTDSAIRSAMGMAAARRCSERFTIARTAPTWLDLLRNSCLAEP
ncbi:MAG: glycosyltransferase family 4 protein [Actinobacteria bacterium]|nr:glycosyltransferase family 4 protein [Actinomycetota bacterium]